MKILALSALLLTVPAAADTPADPLDSCRAILNDHLAGGDGAKALAAIEALPDDRKAMTKFGCYAYFSGIRDILSIQHAGDQKAVSI